ncbi:MAG TPA: hypothetical protein VKG44_06050 [Candidatus Baltobacteraceae bacterium]|nr:hypothetical protein [Candidatus Baltobacteraceae bacterium]
MNACATMRDDLSGVALGAPASAKVSAHLRECAACAADLERQQALALRLEGAVKALVRSDPPVWLAARIAAQARSAARPSHGGRARAVIGTALAAAVAGLIIDFHADHAIPALAPEAAALIAWRSPTDSMLHLRGSVLDAPLRDVWFDSIRRPSPREPTSGDTHAI